MASFHRLVERSQDSGQVDNRLDNLMVEMNLKNSLKGKYEMPIARAMTLQIKPDSSRGTN